MVTENIQLSSVYVQLFLWENTVIITKLNNLTPGCLNPVRNFLPGYLSLYFPLHMILFLCDTLLQFKPSQNLRDTRELF